MVSQALTAPSDDDSETYPSTFIAKNDHYTEALDVIRHSKRLLDRYDRMDKLVLEASDEKQGATGELWDKEVNDMKARLDKRRSTVLRNIQQCLGVNVVHMDHEEDEYMDVEGMVNEGSRNTAPPARNQLKDALRYAERGVKRMTKPLPRDEDHI
ncbi:hypothetical protein B0J11DRAFT_518227 [Dendryphion nanum]|uniref:Uncharacterized protein n=1 Tax=Dendryphion nanum TaxID=256645 RepID=A0A9P9ECJ0_9PLEO|nr:hypothetical protein B0J11DRAFT_518227 [Dendryphion nanum]